MLMVMEHQSGVMNRGTATLGIIQREYFYIQHASVPTRRNSTAVDLAKTPLDSPPGYHFNIPVVFSVAAVTAHDLSRKVELVSVCCSKDSTHWWSLQLETFSGLTDEGKVPTGLVSE